MCIYVLQVYTSLVLRPRPRGEGLVTFNQFLGLHCSLWRIFQLPITLEKTQSVVATLEILGYMYFSMMTQHCFGT